MLSEVEAFLILMVGKFRYQLTAAAFNVSASQSARISSLAVCFALSVSVCMTVLLFDSNGLINEILKLS